MQLRHFLSVVGVVAVLFGLAFVLAPAQALEPYGVSLGAAGLGITRLMGAAFIGIGIIAWFARNAGESPARRAILIGFLIGETVGFVVSLINQFQGLANNLGWSTVAIYGVFALGFAYFLFVKKEGS